MCDSYAFHRIDWNGFAGVSVCDKTMIIRFLLPEVERHTATRLSHSLHVENREIWLSLSCACASIDVAHVWRQFTREMRSHNWMSCCVYSVVSSTANMIGFEHEIHFARSPANDKEWIQCGDDETISIVKSSTFLKMMCFPCTRSLATSQARFAISIVVFRFF